MPSLRVHVLVFALAAVLVASGCASPPSGPSSLAGTNWRPVRIADFTVPADTELGIAFTADGEMSGYDGCNSFYAPYQTDDGEIIFGLMAQTLIGCLYEIPGQRAFNAAVNATRAYRLNGTSLLLFDAAGNELVVLEPAVGAPWPAIWG